MNTKTLMTALTASAALVAGTTHAAIYTVGDFANATSTTQHFNFDSAWAGVPAIDNLTGEESLYLSFTVNWSAAESPGDFIVRYALDDNGGRSRADVFFNDGVVELYAANADGDGDGAGPATARPLFEIDTTTTTSATFVLKVDMTIPSPGGDWNYGTVGQQDEANAFLYVDPNLNQAEANNSTVLAGWRSGQSGYDSLSVVTSNLAAGGMTFSDVTLYTGDDTPFVPEPTSLALLGLGGLLIARRRRA